jgi:Mn-dependent DtxR family transcriptional regulator
MHKFLLFQKLGGGGVESIVEEGVVTAGVLAGELDISRGHAARILNRLVERGLAERCMWGGVAVYVRREVVKAYAMAEEVKKAICRRHKGKKAAVSIRDVAKELNYKNYAVLKAALEILLAPHAEGIYQTTHTTKYIINTTT